MSGNGNGSAPAVEKLVLRSKKVAYMETSTGVYTRMTGFTSMPKSTNPQEYTRKYVDNDFETTDVVGMSTSIDYAFDQYEGNAVHDLLVEIADEEKLGDDAVVSIVVVDFTDPGESNDYTAVKRSFATIPEGDGDGTDAYVYTGTFRVRGERIKGTATSSDNWATCTFVEPTPAG